MVDGILTIVLNQILAVMEEEATIPIKVVAEAYEEMVAATTIVTQINLKWCAKFVIRKVI